MIFRKLFKRRRSGTIARERLQILLVTDRIGCNPNTTESIKNDIINTISNITLAIFKQTFVKIIDYKSLAL